VKSRLVANNCLEVTLEAYHVLEYYLKHEKSPWFDETKIT
jgi:hypothetical protein